VARAQWQGAKAAQRTAGERPTLRSLWTHLGQQPGRRTDPWILGFTFDIPIETAGKRGIRMRQTAALAEAARQNLAETAWQVRRRVRAGLLADLAAQESAAIIKHQAQALDENARLLSERSASGQASPLNAAQANLLSGRNRLALEDAERAQSDTRTQLADAVGVPSALWKGSGFPVPPHASGPCGPSIDPNRRAALLGRPDLLAALANYAASEAALQLEIAKQYPDIHLGPGFAYDQGQNKWSLGLTFTLPVLSQNKGPIAEAEARREEAAARFLVMQDKVINEVDRALAAYQSAYRKLSAADTVLAQQNEQNRTLQDLLRPGDVSRLTLFRSQLDTDSTALARSDAFRQAQEALECLRCSGTSFDRDAESAGQRR